jgi:hypothetical protein
MKQCFLLILLSIPFCAAAQDSTARFVNKTDFVSNNTFKNTTPQKLPANFYTSRMGFFCKQELQLTKKNIPVHFRLGSMDYCNFLEQKPGYIYDPAHK